MNYGTKLVLSAFLLTMALPLMATHYINHTGRKIKITNVTAGKGHKKSYFSSLTRKKNIQPASVAMMNYIELEHDQQGDLDNNQGDEITITSPGMSDLRKLFPTNNSFNYVVTMNGYSKQFENFDINRAGNEDEMLPVASKKAKAAKKRARKEERKKNHVTQKDA